MEQVVTLLQEISKFQPALEEYDYNWMLFSAQNNVFSIVAINDQNNVVGFGSLVIEYKIRGGKLGHVEDIVTSSSYRNEGLGYAILDKLYDFAKENGCYKVALQCRIHNVSFYEKCNYTVSGTAMQRFVSC